ncbi:MAG TPA: hypothetical protein VEZ11_03470 [Thermoanaerobaculia bacterium]|nr:hypothetical protein [Thermoanaerobaculia bacterium]
MRNRTLFVVAFLLVISPALFAQQPPPAGTQTPMTAPPEHPMQMPMHHGSQPDSMKMDCQAMMQKMQKMQASSKAMDDRLATLVTEMNKARGSAKVDRMAAVISELVAQRKQMREDMTAMMPQMMNHQMQHMQSGMMGGMQSMADCPMMGDTASSKSDHHADVMTRGAKGMGFSQEKTTHHFILTDTGGRIEVTANDASDTTDIDAIRQHLTHIAGAFAQGDFALPMFIHDQTPPGVAEMKQLQKAITYRYEEVPRGARVVISTTNPAALKAVHDFLEFQIKDHQTGDPLTVQRGM